MNLHPVLKKWDGVWHLCAQLGSTLLVRERIVCSHALPEFVNFILCKNSFVGYTLVALRLQHKFKNVAD